MGCCFHEAAQPCQQSILAERLGQVAIPSNRQCSRSSRRAPARIGDDGRATDGFPGGPDGPPSSHSHEFRHLAVHQDCVVPVRIERLDLGCVRSGRCRPDIRTDQQGDCDLPIMATPLGGGDIEVSCPPGNAGTYFAPGNNMRLTTADASVRRRVAHLSSASPPEWSTGQPPTGERARAPRLKAPPGVSFLRGVHCASASPRGLFGTPGRAAYRPRPRPWS